MSKYLKRKVKGAQNHFVTLSSGSEGGVGLSSFSSEIVVFSLRGVDFLVLISFEVPDASADFGLRGTRGILKKINDQENHQLV